jgi:hypothetical protein
LKRARADKRAILDDEVMELEFLLHDLEEEKAWWEKRTALPEANTGSYDSLRSAFEQLMQCERIWDVTAEKIGQQYRSLATAVIDRKPVNLGIQVFERLHPYQKALHFHNANGADLYVFPHVLAVHDPHRGLALISLKDIRLDWSISRFHEDEQVPSDTQAVGYTWRYANKDGSPDLRFRDNYKIPIVLYEQIDFITNSGLNERYLISNPEKAENFCRTFLAYQRVVEAFPLALYEEAYTPDQNIIERRRAIEERISVLPKRRSRVGINAVIVALLVLLVFAGIYAWQTGFFSIHVAQDQELDISIPAYIDVTPDQVVGEQGKHTLVVIAAKDKLSPIRATVDQDVRRPYWMELGKVVQFNWNERLFLEGDIWSMQLVLDGYAYEPSDEKIDQLELTDSLAVSFLRPVLR